MTITLHMDTDQVYACVARLRAYSEEIRSLAQELVVSARSVEWYSPARDIFQAELEHVALAITRLADEGGILAVRMQREADQWQQTDDYFAQQFSQVIISYFQKG